MSRRRRKRRRNPFSIFVTFLGILLLVGALGIVLYNRWDGDRAARAAEEITGKLLERIQTENASSQKPKKKPDGYDDEEEVVPEMPVVEIDGYLYIGTLSIPSLGLTLPVMADWDYDRLKISPCWYAGSYFTDDLVICGHNYARHFSPIKWIDPGAEVIFTTVKDEEIHYTVSNRETVRPMAVEEMIDRENGNWDLTLFTCNTGGQTRCAVRCERMSDLPE